VTSSANQAGLADALSPTTHHISIREESPCFHPYSALALLLPLLRLPTNIQESEETREEMASSASNSMMLLVTFFIICQT
jgi:hypothetical protein